MQEATAFFLLTDGTDTSKAELHLEYTLYLDKNGKQKVREEVKGGPNNNSVPRETLENISLLYLGAIRNGSVNPNFETADKIAVRLWVAIRDCKGAFAQDLSREIVNGICEEGDNFKFEVPQYIKETFDEILK